MGLQSAHTAETVSPCVVYVGGYGRSGSTLLDILIGDRLHSVGELSNLPRHFVEQDLACTCGASFAECEFWSQVISEYAAGGSRETAFRALRKFHEAEGWRSFARLLLPWLAGEVPPGFVQSSQKLYRAIFRCSGSGAIIESSKTAGWCASRPALLQRACGLDVKLIHLIRDPRGIYHSARKGRNRDLRTKSPAKIENRSLLGLRALGGWFFANVAATVNGILLGADRYLVVRYEELVGNPVSTLEQISAFLQLDFHEVLARIERREAFGVGHLVGGNRMAKTRQITLRQDVEWSQVLSASQQIGIWLLTFPLALAAGYKPFIRRPRC